MKDDDKLYGKILSLINDIENSDLMFNKFYGTEKPLIITVNNKITKVRFSLQENSIFTLSQLIFVRPNGVLIEKSDISKVSASTIISKGTIATNVLSSNEKVFSTRKEKNPWLEIEFIRPFYIKTVEVFNESKKNKYFRALSIKVDIVNIADNIIEVYNNYQWLRTIENTVKNSNTLSDEAKILLLGQLYAKTYAVGDFRKLVNNLSKEQKNISIQLHDHINTQFNKIGFGFTHHGINRTFAMFSEKEKLELITELASFMSLLNEKFSLFSFITSGTLLGAIRDDSLLNHDDDLDISYISAYTDEKSILNERLNLATNLKELGFKVKISARDTHIQVHFFKGITLDLFVSFTESDFINVSPLPRNQLKKSSVLPLKNIKLHDVLITVPNNSVHLLVNNYGENWMKRDPSWRFDWDRAFKEYNFLLKRVD
jgi:hypothetical protein